MKSKNWLKIAKIKCRCGEVADGIIEGKDSNKGKCIEKKVHSIDCKHRGLRILDGIENNK